MDNVKSQLHSADTERHRRTSEGHNLREAIHFPF